MYIKEVGWLVGWDGDHGQAWLNLFLHDAGQTSERNESVPQQFGSSWHPSSTDVVQKAPVSIAVEQTEQNGSSSAVHELVS